MTFELEACRFQLSARRVIQFPPGMAGNVLRGALGKGLRHVASQELYSRLFDPKASASGPSGLHDRPRPFVLRCAALNGRVIEAGEKFCFGLNLFDYSESSLDHFARAFAQWADVTSLDHRRVTADLSAPGEPVSRIRVEFQTPTMLKGADASAPADFSVLLARARDRVSTLRALYGAGPLAIDFRDIAERARSVETVRSDLRPVAVARRSGRAGRSHSIGGLVGFAEYEGSLAEFVPYLEAASWTGVGRHCAWGNGQIGTRILET